MAQDIVNASLGDASGNQKIGGVTVNTGGRGTNSYQTLDDSQVLTPITGLDTQYDERFDDPRYYQGDAVT